MSDDDKLKRTWGYVAEFETAAQVYEAAKKMRDEGFRRWDVHSPFPIHGMDAAMGLGPSYLSRFVFCGGLLGGLSGLALQFGTQVGLYPTIVQGKPDNLYSLPAFFPVTFELTILFSAFTIVGALFLIIRLPRLHHPLFESKIFTRFSDDAFMITVEARDPRFARDSTREFLEGLGARQVELIDEEI